MSSILLALAILLAPCTVTALKANARQPAALDSPKFSLGRLVDKIDPKAYIHDANMHSMISKGGELCYEGSEAELQHELEVLASNTSNVRYGFDTSVVQRGYCRDHGFFFAGPDHCFPYNKGAWFGALFYGPQFDRNETTRELIMRLSGTELLDSIYRKFIRQGRNQKRRVPSYTFPLVGPAAKRNVPCDMPPAKPTPSPARALMKMEMAAMMYQPPGMSSLGNPLNPGRYNKQ